MKRMKKKVVAMVTLAMFLMTLLPMAAFAAEATPENSYVSFDYDNPTVDTNEVVVVKAHTYADAEQEVPAQLNNVRIWLTDDNKNDAIVKDAKFGSLNVDKDGLQSVWTTTHNSQANGIPDGIVKGHLVNDQEFGVVIPNEGVYTLHVGQVQKDAAGNDYVAEVDYDNGATITVNAQVEDQMTFVGESANPQDPVEMIPVDDVVTVTKDMLKDVDFQFNGVDTYTVTGTLLDDQGKIMKNKDVTLSSNKEALSLEDETVTTERDGSFEIEFSLDAEVNAAITVAYGDLTYTVRVDAADSDLENINTVKEDGYVLAGTDTKNWPNASKQFTDAVQFEITDQNGNVVLNGLDSSEPATVTGGDHSKYVKVAKPDNSTLVADDLLLVWNNEEEVYTLEYKGDAKAAKKDLVEGEYTVTVALLSGDSATATFNVAKFGDVEELVVDAYAKTAKSNPSNYAKVENEIALGDDLGLKAKYVDANGLKIAADNVSLGADGKAIKEEYKDKYGNGYYEFALAENNVTNEALIGTVIKIVAFDDNEDKLVEKELTVVDAYDTYSLAFDSNEGEVNVDNNVEVSIVDADENVAKKVNAGTVKAYVAKQSNEDAKVTVDVQKSTVNKGKFEIKVYSNKATTADIVVAVKAGEAIYAGTLSYTFGEEDIPAGTSVVMTLGSTEMIINNEVVDMKDAAPFAQDNRTYVPFRALGEALGAKVDFDKDAKTVTYKLGSTEIVMTLDSKDYTVNGAKKTMDVAPFAKDNRTYVPVRFVGEGLGFTVTGLTNANGQYVAVAFTK